MFSILLTSVRSTKVIIFDAGSSSTRVYGYEYADAKDPLSFVALRDSNESLPFYRKCEIPLANVADNNSLISDIYFELLTNYSDKLIPENERKDVRFLIYATAGMRYLTKEKQDEVMDLAYKTAKANFKYSVKRDDFKVITGSEEGIFAWVGLNRLIKTFGGKAQTLPHFEIGGASLQVASEVPEHTNDELDQFIYDITIGANKYHVFAHSYLGFGGDRASLAVHTALYKEGKSETPCALRETPFNITIDGAERHFTGTGKYDECYELFTKHVFTKQDKCGKYPCIFYDNNENKCIPLPLEFKQIYAQGVPAVSSDFLADNYPEMNNKTMDINKYKNVSHRFVETFTYWTAKEQNDEWRKYKYMHMAFLQQVLTINFVERGFNGIVDNLVLKAESKIDGTEPQWTLGAVMTACSPNVSYRSGLTPLYLGLIIAGALVVVILIVVSIVVCIRKRRAKLRTDSILDTLIA